MLTAIFGKTKLPEEKATNIFVNSLLDLTDKGFPELAAIINEAPEFVKSPSISPDNSDTFLLILLAGNISYIPEYFEAGRDERISDLIVEKFSIVFEIEKEHLKKVIKEYQNYFFKINHPSKNTLYAMSKAFFFKYDLCQYQEEYFRKMNFPNPMLLKRIDEAMENFLWDWNVIKEKYQVVS